MIDQTACQNASRRVVATGDLRRPKCPDCGSVLLIAEASRFNLRGRIDHAWSCDGCGIAFVTSIWLAAAFASTPRWCLPV